jgi:hypothetical protein
MMADCVLSMRRVQGKRGLPRATKDLDVLVEPERENARRTLRALKSFLGTVRGITETKLTNPRTLVRARGAFGDVDASYLGLRDLLKAKRASGRAQDLADVEALENHRAPREQARTEGL